LFINSADKEYLISHIFPVSTNIVWYATMYIGILMLSPLLNILLLPKYMKTTKKIVIILLFLFCFVPTFFPKFSRMGSLFSWFVIAYLFIGLLKLYNIRINKIIAITMFVVGWLWCILFFDLYIYFIKSPEINVLFGKLGFYNNVYFADLATIPPVISALGIFYLFKDLRFSWFKILGKVISIASLDVYVFFSIESPSKKLAWVEIFNAGYSPASAFNCYKYIFFGLLIAIFLGNIREVLWRTFISLKCVNRFFERVNKIFIQ